ncbi:MAG: S-layer family protein [Leptolyngbya sp. SIO1E4]|nr:S-layer family protein [Leptolyngbya sp. SIO1E4]
MRHLLSRTSQGYVWATKTFHAPLAAIAITSVGCILSQGPGWAQLIPDTSLGGESSVVVPNVTIDGLPSDRIDGGAVRGSNLFHSFEAFNVPAGRGVYFANPAVVETIINRVTGNTATDIFGTLGVLGNADVFLINPNGILFGPDAQLDVNGSFVASTANHIEFADGLQFSATNPQSPPLLTISTPVGLQFGANPGSIVHQSTAPDPFNNPTGLQVPPDQVLALVGGEILLDGGHIVSPGSHIELGGLAGEGTVAIADLQADDDTDTAHLQFPSQIERANITLRNRSRVDGRGNNGGSITVNANNLAVLEISALGTGIASEGGFPGAQAGDLTINATGSVVVDGSDSSSFRNSAIFSQIDPGAIGNAGDIIITTGSLSVANGASLTSASFGQGDTGTINIQAADTVQVDGSRPNIGVPTQLVGRPTQLGTSVGTIGIGNGGDVIIRARSLWVTGGAQLNTGTSGNGNGGNVKIQTTDAIILDGFVTQGSNPNNFGRNSRITTLVNPSAVGNAGDISLITNSLSATQGAFISTTTFGQGRAGRLRVEASEEVSLVGVNPINGVSSGLFSATEIDPFTPPVPVGPGNTIQVFSPSLELADGAVLSSRSLSDQRGGDILVETTTLDMTGGAQIISAAFSEGAAGDIIINAADSINLSGTDPTYSDRLAEFGRELVEPDGPESAITSSSPGTGAAGRVQLETNHLQVQAGAKVSVSSLDVGTAGNLEIEADDIRLNNGILTAETAEGDQGNIALDASVVLLLGNSNITTNASDIATGGNITISADVLVALGNSDITANAVEGPGGNIQITTQGLFQSSDSDITASSELGVDGVVDIQELGADPDKGLVELPSGIVDPDTLIATSCLAPSRRQQGRFRIVGAGGLPTLPGDRANSSFQTLAVPLTREAADRDLNVAEQELDQSDATRDEVLVEASGMYPLEDGRLVLGRVCGL